MASDTADPISDETLAEAINGLLDRILAESKPLPPDEARILNENAWDLYISEAP